MRRPGVRFRLNRLALALAMPGLCFAGAMTDGTTGAVQTLSGNFAVPQSLGTVAGGNLFHSFRSFGLAGNESATFTTSSAAIANVITRVTGGEASNIQGVLRLTPAAGSVPAFYFINPAGVTFGNGAVVSVPGALYVSTAQRLAFADGMAWDTRSAAAGALSAAAPESFGFLAGAAAGRVTLNNRSLATGSIVSQCISIPTCHRMQMRSGASTAIVAGDVEIEDTELYTPGVGQFRVVAAGAATVTVPINGPLVGVPTGSLSVVRGTIAAERTPSTIEIRAGSVDLGNEGEIYTINQSSALAGGSIDIAASSSVRLSAGAEIGSVSFAAGSAADLRVTAASLEISGDDHGGVTGIVSDTRSTGAGGNVALEIGGTVRLRRGGVISVSTGGAGNAGSLALNAGGLEIDRSASPVTIVDGRDQYTTGIFSDTTAAGAAGNLSLALAGDALIRGGGAVSSRTSGSGPAGSVTLNARNLEIEGVAAGTLFTGVTTQAESGSTGNAGDVAIAARGAVSLRMAGAVTSDTFGSGAAGSVTLAAARVTADGAGSGAFTGVSTEAGAGSGGQAGRIEIAAGESVSLANTAQVSIRSHALVAAPAALTPARIRITAPVLSLVDGAAVTAEATRNVNAGSIEVRAGSSLSMTGAAITTSARDGDGGAIAVATDGAARLADSRITTSVTGSSGNGGDISLVARDLVLRTGFVQANTTAALASGGRIDVRVANLLASGRNLLVGGSVIRALQAGAFGFNVIQAAAPTGVNGDVVLSSPQLDLSSALGSLASAPADVRSLVAEACQIPAGSSLVVMPRGGLPARSAGPLRPESHDPGGRR